MYLASVASQNGSTSTAKVNRINATSPVPFLHDPDGKCVYSDVRMTVQNGLDNLSMWHARDWAFLKLRAIRQFSGDSMRKDGSMASDVTEGGDLMLLVNTNTFVCVCGAVACSVYSQCWTRSVRAGAWFILFSPQLWQELMESDHWRSSYYYFT